MRLSATDNTAYCAVLRSQYAKNADGLAGMLERAIATGRKVNGYTADQLRDMVARYRRFSMLDDHALLNHLEESRARIHNRLEELRSR